MKLLNSIKGRLIATVVLSQCLLAAGLLATGVYYTHRRLLSTLDASMHARATSIAALVRYTEDATGNVYFDNTLMPGSVDPSHPDLFAVWTERTGVLVRSANWPKGLDISPALSDEHWKFIWAGVPYRGLRVSQVPVLDREEGARFHPQTLTIIYASPMIRLQDQVREAGGFIALCGAVLVGVTVLLALWGVRRGLLPLKHLTAQASQVSAQNWKFLPPADAQQVAELRPLTESMTTMLARLQRSFEQEREFVGNAAHELKTPVAVLKSTLQSLLHRPRSPEEYQTGVQHALEDLDRLEQLLQWMMRLTRAEQWANGALRRDLPLIDLSATCEEAIERIRTLAQARNTRIHLAAGDRPVLRADPEDLQLVWVNLLENAVRYSPEGGSVEVSVGRNNGGPARVVFEDHGVGIAPEDLPHIFDRFYRGDHSRTRATGGFGLGLAIARALIDAYGGTIRADSVPGRGTRMTVELPVSAD